VFLLTSIGNMKGMNLAYELMFENLILLFQFNLLLLFYYNFSLNGFRPHKTIEKAAASAAPAVSNEEHPSIQIKEVYKPKGVVIDLKFKDKNVYRFY
jgi:hypothetical protein